MRETAGTCLLRKLVPALIAAAALATMPFATRATTFVELSLADMAASTELAAHAVVSEIEVVDFGGDPWTVVTFAVQDMLAGESVASFELAFLGGSIGDQSVSVLLMPEFSIGDEIIVLAYEAQYISPIVGFNQGLWRLTVRGFEDERGRLLSLDDDGELQPSGAGAPQDELLEALRRLIEESS